MKKGKKLKIFLCFFVILLMSFYLIDLVSYYLIGAEINIKYFIFDTIAIIYWIYLLKNTIKNKNKKSETITK